jgi:hypothetical protein
MLFSLQSVPDLRVVVRAWAELQEAYERMLFRDALKNAAYDLGSARDLYRCEDGR